MAWMLPVLVRRAVAQRAVLAVVLVLTVLTTTAVASSALLLTVVQDRAPGAVLAGAPPEDLRITVEMGLRELGGDEVYDAREAYDATGAALRALVAPGRLSTTAWPESGLLSAAPANTPPREGPVTYMTAVPGDGSVEVLRGELPGADGRAAHQDPADGVVPVAVPERAARDLGLRTGDRFRVRGLDGHAPAGAGLTVEVTGVYRVADRHGMWPADMLGGTGYAPEVALPGSAGELTTPVHGPLLAPAGVLLGGTVTPARLTVGAVPDLTGLTADRARTIAGRMPVAQTDVAAALDGAASWPRLESALGATLEGLLARLAVTRTAVLAIALVLMVVGGAAALLAARLLAEQRAADVALATARGVSRRQLVVLSAAEAAGVGLVTAVSATPASALVVRAVLGLMPGTAGPPAATTAIGDLLAAPAPWLAAAGSAAVLAGLLVVPVLRRDAGRARGPRARPAARNRRAAPARPVTARSAGVMVVTAVAVVAAWQLLTRPPTGGRVDPVLIAAPALVVLAGGLLAVLTLPALARLTDRLAARSHRLVAPLAAWEYGRRPERAAHTMLLAALAVAAATFALVTLTTWRASQEDQAALAAGAPTRLSDVDGSPFDAAGEVRRFEEAQGLALSPVTTGPVTVSGAGPDTEARLLAVDDGALLRGRLTPVAGIGEDVTWADLLGTPDGRAGTLAGEVPGGRLPGVPLPPDATRLSADVTVPRATRSGGTRSGDVPYLATTYAVLQDARGVLGVRMLTAEGSSWARLPSDGVSRPVSATLRDDGRAVAGRVRLVAFLSRVQPEAPDQVLVTDTSSTVDVGVRLSGLSVTAAGGAVTDVGLDGPWAGHAMPGPLAFDAPADDGVLTLTRTTALRDFAGTGAAFTGVPDSGTGRPGSWLPDATAPVPAVITEDLASAHSATPGDVVTIHAPVPVPLRVTGVVRHLPGGPGGGVLLRHGSLARAQLAQAAEPSAPDEWWGRGTASPGPAPGRVTTLAERTRVQRDGPDRAGLQAALVLLVIVSAGTTVIGTATSVAGGLHLRRLELARLAALGVSRRALVRSVVAEQGLLLTAGVVCGSVVGGAVAALLAPRLAVGPDGGPAVPEALLVVPWAWLGAFAVVVAGFALAAAGTTARLQVRRARADLLRLGADR